MDAALRRRELTLVREVAIRAEGARAGLVVTEAGPRGLSLEADAYRRLRLVLDGAPIAWGRVAPALAGITWVRRPGAESPAIVPPIRASEARTHAVKGDWCKTFARELVRSPRSPLRPGEWELAALTPRPRRDAARSVTADEHYDGDTLLARRLGSALDVPRASFSEWRVMPEGQAIPLRDASREDAARVKAFRKLAREGVLPPVLLWWVSAIAACVVLDGHDRILAAKLEGVPLGAIAVSGVREWPSEPVWVEAAIARYEQAFANEARLSARTREQENERLVFASGGYRSSWTPSVARGDLGARFEAELAFVDDPAIRAQLFA